ncbi:MAG TPA: acetolactate synthase small subunit [Candidatus Egerieicola faecale]|uniref:Acetolactate synthase small subunit n=1 Tax=Candidatus Egerieicola faecale TaxID=2840774 RepID=A0A9D1IS45_9FIRM|nr:acetolactate synthase small subunit [Candidatus Egerieicola faecale]
MKHTISILVENHAGVLSRISGLFSRRSFNIDSLAVGVTDDPTVSRITIIVNGDEYTVEQVTKQLNKMVDVIKLKQLDSSSDICRELLLIKVRCNAKNRSDLIDIAQLMQAKISDLSSNSFTLELSDTPQRLALMEEMLRPYGILEEVRTGAIALQHGTEVL